MSTSLTYKEPEVKGKLYSFVTYHGRRGPDISESTEDSGVSVPKSRKNQATKRLKEIWAIHVRTTMEKCELTGVKVSKEVGVSEQVVSDWRMGRTLPSVENLVAYSKLVEEPISWLLGDRLHGISSIDHLSHQLGLRLGFGRLAELAEIPAHELTAETDRIIGHYVSQRRKAKPRA